MRKNDSYETIAEVLRKADSILVFPHVHADGDAMGSAAAICRTLRRMGKVCHVVVEDEIPENLQFLDQGYTIPVEEVDFVPEVSLCIDCGEDSRYPERVELFHKATVTLCVDHHLTSRPDYDYNIIDPEAAATAELVYELLCAVGQPLDKETAEALFTGITTDTGNFQYSNTTGRTHRIVAELYECGIDASRISVLLYESRRPEQMMIESRILSNMKLYGNGRIAIASVTQEEMQKCNVRPGETDNVVALLRSMRGVEIAAFLKEKEKGETRVSLRAKGERDVAAIAAQYNGGGHKKAAGATIPLPLPEAIEDLKKKALRSIAEHE